MKKILPISLLIITLFAACKSDPKKDLDVKKDFVLMDTTKIYPNNSTSDTGMITRTTVVTPPVAIAPAPREKQRVSPAPRATKIKPVVKNNQPSNSTNTANNTTTTTTGNGATPAKTNTGNTKADTVAKAAPVVKKKEGWSDAAKDATIGGVGGAAAGAIIGRNGKGAVIGGILGAAGGYLFGRKKDRQSGRVDTTKH